ncbi:MAG: hypothetical protein N3F64_07250 [Nitrososphaeria archaeon]|nr:hypothetical protein [Nitrososphaeria archaeon]
MVYRNTLETSIRILEAIAKNREIYQYDLPKIIGKSYRQILRHLEQLEDINFIHVIRFEPSTKKGKDKKVYELTLNGLLAYLQYIAIKNPERFAGAVKGTINLYVNHLPLIFGKWNLWLENDLDWPIIKSLQKILTEEIRPLADLIWAINLKQSLNIIENEKLKKNISKLDEVRTHEQNTDTQTIAVQQIWTTKILLNLEEGLETKLYETIKKDSELTNFMKQILQDTLNKHIKDIYNIKSWMKILE